MNYEDDHYLFFIPGTQDSLDSRLERASPKFFIIFQMTDLAQHRGEQYPSYNWIVRLQEEYLNDSNNRRDAQKYQGVLDMFAEYGEYSHQEMKKCYNAMHLPEHERECVMRKAGQVIMTNGGFKALQYNWYTMVNFVLGRCNCESRCPNNREVHYDIKNTISASWYGLVDSSGNMWRS